MRTIFLVVCKIKTIMLIILVFDYEWETMTFVGWLLALLSLFLHLVDGHRESPSTVFMAQRPTTQNLIFLNFKQKFKLGFTFDFAAD